MNFRRFQSELRNGKHVLMVDVPTQQEAIVRQVTAARPGLEAAGEGDPTPGWVIGAQQKWTRFMQLAP